VGSACADEREADQGRGGWLSVAASLKEIVEYHLHYEVAMLFATYNKLADGVEDGKIANALIESFCIHARALNDFLLSRSYGVHADRVTTGYKPFARGGISKRDIKKINEQIAHLGKHRTRDPKKQVNRHTRTRMVKALGEELLVLQRHWKRRFVTPWHVVPHVLGYELRRPSQPAIVLRLR
jgi:hypothetical protein